MSFLINHVILLNITRDAVRHFVRYIHLFFVKIYTNNLLVE